MKANPQGKTSIPTERQLPSLEEMKSYLQAGLAVVGSHTDYSSFLGEVPGGEQHPWIFLSVPQATFEALSRDLALQAEDSVERVSLTRGLVEKSAVARETQLTLRSGEQEVRMFLRSVVFTDALRLFQESKEVGIVLTALEARTQFLVIRTDWPENSFDMGADEWNEGLASLVLTPDGERTAAVVTFCLTDTTASWKARLGLSAAASMEASFYPQGA